MMKFPKAVEAIPVGRLFLSFTNPRHEPVVTEAKAIEKLCKREQIYQLAKDIAKHGTNPLERLALLSIDSKNVDKPTSTYYVAEGNRRICAIKLLNDPELAPADLRKPFEKLALNWTPIKSVPGVIFETMEEVDLWLDRIHNGLQGGIGRKQWDSEQKARHDGDNKNRTAQALLDYAEKEGMITNAERSRKITTVQRFLSNAVFREMLGVDQTISDDIGRTRPKPEFDILVKRFMRDLVAGKAVNSRMNQEDINGYARPLASIAGVTAHRTQSESLSEAPQSKSKSRKDKGSKRPDKIKNIQYQDEIAEALKTLGNEKLKSLYFSICDINLDPHTPIVAIGTWSFFETLTACAGRHDRTPIDGFFSKVKLQSYGFAADTLSLQTALVRIREFGNTTKHHPNMAAFNGDQLNNDVTGLKAVILKCIAEAVEKDT